MKINYTNIIIGIVVTLFVASLLLFVSSRNKNYQNDINTINENQIGSDMSRALKEIEDTKLTSNILKDNPVNKTETINKNDFGDYSIIKIDRIRNVKASIDVRLKREFYKSEIVQLANKLKAELNQDFERIFISYYMSGMKAGSVAWATSHFDPNLKVVMTSEFYDDTKIKEVITPSRTDAAVKIFKEKYSSAEIIGKWYQGNNFIVIIYKKNSKNYLIEINIDYLNIGNSHELITKKKGGEKVYIVKDLLYPTNENGVIPLNDYTDYYKIEQNGDLSICDETGIIERYNKVN